MKFPGRGLGRGGLRYVSTWVLRQRRGHGRTDWLRLLLIINMVLAFAVVALFVLRNHPL